MMRSSNDIQETKKEKSCWASLFFCCNSSEEEKKPLIASKPLPANQTMDKPPVSTSSNTSSKRSDKINVLSGIPVANSIGFSMMMR